MGRERFCILCILAFVVVAVTIGVRVLAIITLRLYFHAFYIERQGLQGELLLMVS